MKSDLTEIKNYLANKNVVLLGNAKSILKNPKNIEDYDVVCRINKGVPSGNVSCLGIRTDVLFIATTFDKHLRNQFNAKFVVWTTECQKLATEWIKENAIQNPPEDWQELKLKTENFLPSTGIVTLYFLIKHIKFKSLTIYGYDNFSTSSFYCSCKAQKWHSGEIEKKLMEDLIKKNNRVQWIKE